MVTNINETVSQGLSLITYNGNSLAPLQANQSNLFMGIGLWSVKDGLSEGLPIDVMQMLLTATLIRTRIKETHLESSPKVIVLIADSMAVQEGAEREKVAQVANIYKLSLEHLLDLLNLKECSEIMLSSDLESLDDYKDSLKTIKHSSIAKQLKREDRAHYAYIRTQTAITHYMHKHRLAGVKVGWASAESGKQLHDRVSLNRLTHWDELKFDRWCEAICQESTMQYVYAKAGLKQAKHGKHVSVREGCPYTAYAKDQRYIVQTQREKDLKTICPLQKQVASHWKGVAEVCAGLMEAHIASPFLLPEDSIRKSNVVATVYNMLNHWLNAPKPSSENASPAVPTALMNCFAVPLIEERTDLIKN